MVWWVLIGGDGEGADCQRGFLILRELEISVAPGAMWEVRVSFRFSGMMMGLSRL